MSDDADLIESDIVFVEPTAAANSLEAAGRCVAERCIAGMTGRYTLDSWRDAQGISRVFPCRVLKMSARAIELSAPVTGTAGERVCVHFDKLGRFEGPIVRKGQRSFVMKIVATADEAEKIARKIAWIEDRTRCDARRHERFVPFDPAASITLSNGSVLPCQILNYSASGAAVSVDHDPSIGAAVRLGKVAGSVVRRFDGGFAVVFAAIQPDQAVAVLVKTQPEHSR